MKRGICLNYVNYNAAEEAMKGYKTYRSSHKSSYKCGLSIAVATLLISTTTLNVAFGAEIYLTGYRVLGGDGNELAVVEGDQVKRQWPAVADGHAFALAVADTVRTLPVRPPGTSPCQTCTSTGAEYTLLGVPTGVTYEYPFSSWVDDIPEGTTDGKYNYAGAYFTSTVYRFSRDWTNPTELFQVPGFYLGGIAYDATNDSLWVLDSLHLEGGQVRNYALDGTLLSAFAVSKEDGQQPFGLAVDPSDHTLWLSRMNTFAPFNSDPRLQHYSVTGQFLGEQVYPTLNGLAVIGMETVVPLPAGIWLFVSGLSIIPIFRRSHHGLEA